MSQLRNAITIFLLSFLYLPASAQVLEDTDVHQAISDPKDSAIKVPKSDPAWQLASQLQLGNDSFQKWDSSFILVHRYNPILRNGTPFTDLSVTGGPQKLLLFDPAVKPGFYVGLNVYPLQNRNTDSMKFYRAKVPLTRFSYVQGADGVFLLDAQHTQNILKNWNISLDYASIQNAEIYPNSYQNHLHRGTMLGSNYQTENGRYSNQVIFSWNRARRNENRGLLADSFFFIPDSGNTRILGNYFPTSTTAKSFYAKNHHVLDQRYHLTKGGELYVFHHLDWIKEKYEYNESSAFKTPEDSLFYGNDHIFTDSAFHDSSVWIQYNNSFGFGGKAEKKQLAFYWRTWVSADHIVYNSNYKTESNIYFNQALHALLDGNWYAKQSFKWTANADYYYAGYNAGDYLVQANASWKYANRMMLGAQIKSQQYQAAYYSTRFAGNYILYYTDRKSVMQNSISVNAAFRSKFISLSGKFTAGTANNYLYADSDSRFQQLDNIAFANLEGNVNFHLGKFHFTNKFTWQQHNQRQLIPYPEFSILSGLYFEGRIFKKVLLARMGVDFWYMSDYTGYLYQPMNATFYPGNKTAGNYPYGDVYFSGEVKTMLFFFKVEHVNNYMSNYGFNHQYISAIPYPTEPLRFRLGIVWRFYN